VKLGGSLLELSDCVERLLKFLETVANPVIVIGGGSPADYVRHWDRNGILSSHEAHWLAIATMSFNALQLVEGFNQFRLAANRADAAAIAELGKTPVLDVMSLLKSDQTFATLPESWDVTSDSISAFIARAWNAELCLLKSVDPGPNPAEHLDSYFCEAASGMPKIGWTNLRDAPTTVELLNVPSDISNA